MLTHPYLRALSRMPKVPRIAGSSSCSTRLVSGSKREGGRRTGGVVRVEVARRGGVLDGVHALHGLVERAVLHPAPVSADHADPTAAHLHNVGDDGELELVAVCGEELAQMRALVDGTHGAPYGETFIQQRANDPLPK